jgi:hypothetical protein
MNKVLKGYFCAAFLKKMRRLYHIFFSVTLALMVTGFAIDARAQEVVFRATASAAKMGTRDQIQVTYSIQNAPENAQFMSPEFKDFDAQGPSRSSNTSITQSGNQMVQVNTYQFIYLVHPRRTGTLTIPAASIKDAAGHVYHSNTIQIEVVNGSLAQQQQQQRSPFDDEDDLFAQMQQQMQRMHQAMMQRQMQQYPQQPQSQPQQQQATVNDLGKDLFLRVEVDRDKVHVGEQVTATYKLYARIPMQMNISKLPALNGFWTQDFQLPRQMTPVEETYNGKKYQVFTVKKSALFPQQAGTLTLDPAEAQGMARIVQQVRQRSPFADFFDDPVFRQNFGGSLAMNDPMFDQGFFNTLAYRDVPAHVKSAPVKITVTPLPETGKPADYGNAVGNFTLSGKMDKTELTTDDAATYTLTIAGSGNLKLIAAPALKLPNGLDTYDPLVVDTITDRTTKITGSKIITYPIAPNTPGDYTIPAISFSYFNAQSGSYVTLHTEPVKIHVKPGKNYNPSLAQNRQALTDIHPIITGTTGKTTARPILYTAGYWSAFSVPLLAFIGLLVWKRRDEELSKDVVKLKHRKANKIALKRLATAKKLLQEKKHQAFYEEVSKAIWLYLSDKLNIPLSALSRETANDAMTARNVPDALQQQAAYVVDDCEISLYAPSGSSSQQMNKTYEQAIDVISKLEEIFK